MQTAIKELQPLIIEKGLTSALISEDEEMLVEADRYMVLQALLNIIENAVKYSERGGILVRTGRREEMYYVSVKDNGIGISEEFLPRLFLEFTQESEGYTKRYQGLGLGLVLAKRYVELNGGNIEVESTKHKGSVFTINLPIPQEDPVPEASGPQKG